MKRLVAFALLGSAAAASASNSGFKLRLPLPFAPTTANAYWLSLPYRYFPSGNVGQAGQNSLDLCRDLNSRVPGGAKVSQVGRFVSSTDQPRIQSCTSPLKAFDLQTGEGYFVKAREAGVVIELIGAHDDSYAPNKTATPTLIPLVFNASGSNNNLVSLPYHAKARNSLDLCAELNAGRNPPIVYSVVKLDGTRQVPRSQPCAGRLKAFDLSPGEAYSFKPAMPGIHIGFDVW